MSDRYELGTSGFYPTLRRGEEMESHRLSSSATGFARFLLDQLDVNRQWGESEWFSRLSDPAVEMHAVFCMGEPVGCFELSKLEDAVEITVIGLGRNYRGCGLGKSLFTTAVEKAFAMGAVKVWCTLPEDRADSLLPLIKFHGFRLAVPEDV